jgi:hypothetical protein
MRRALTAAAVSALVLLGPRLAVAQQAKTDSAAADQALIAAAALLAQARADGQTAGAKVSTGGWFGGGFVSGLVLTLLGTGIAYAVAADSKVELPPDQRLLITSRPFAYQQAYADGFREKVKSKRKSSALKGGLVATSAWVVLFIVASASGDGY